MSNINEALEAMETLKKELKTVPEIAKLKLSLGINPTNGKYVINLTYALQPKLVDYKSLKLPLLYKGFYLVSEKFDSSKKT